MSINPQYDPIGKTFVHQYYSCFDDPAQRATLAAFYNEEKSLMTFEDQQLFGRTKIMEKIQTDDDHPHTFHQTFVLKSLGDSFYVEHDIFRLALHHIG